MDVYKKKQTDPLLNTTFFNNFVITKKLGEGSFGRIYQAENNGEYYALKFESKIKSQSLLEAEANYMNYLQGRNNNTILFFNQLEFLISNSFPTLGNTIFL